MTLEGAHRAAGISLAAVAALVAWRRRDVRPFAAYASGFVLCELLRAQVPRETGLRVWVVLQHALYLAPRSLGALYAVGATTGQRWPTVAGAALLGGCLAGLAALYPLGPERLSIAWSAIEGVAVGLAALALALYYRRDVGPGPSAGLGVLVVTLTIAGDVGRWLTVYLAHARNLGEGWPSVRLMATIVQVLCLIVLTVSGLGSSPSSSSSPSAGGPGPSAS